MNDTTKRFLTCLLQDLLLCKLSLDITSLAHVWAFRTNLDIPSKKMSILAPNQGSLTGKTAIIGSFEWQDQ